MGSALLREKNKKKTEPEGIRRCLRLEVSESCNDNRRSKTFLNHQSACTKQGEQSAMIVSCFDCKDQVINYLQMFHNGSNLGRIQEMSLRKATRTAVERKRARSTPLIRAEREPQREKKKRKKVSRKERIVYSSRFVCDKKERIQYSIYF
jgi:hypothetical protein